MISESVSPNSPLSKRSFSTWVSEKVTCIFLLNLTTESYLNGILKDYY